MTETLAEALSLPHFALHLWHPDTLELIWPTAGLAVPRSYQEALVALAPRWVFATIDKAGRGGVITVDPDYRRVWSGEMRIATNDPWAQVETRGTDPAAAIRAEFYPKFAGPIATDPWSDGWHPSHWWRVVLSDGTVWSESSDRAENLAKLRAIRGNMITVYPPGHPEGKRYGPDHGAHLQRRYDRVERTWRDEDLADE
ncbi:hypothetical protein PP556_14670 [Mycobacteroides abscessus]|nr:hypothetical protein [Mycobacteroides abscessus]MDM2451173.1 hypothetical protein [Mycobacteroides abscessus]MDM2455681.1 hypothetical protein [Mycobacteroides abscessus]MDM2460433.1 hypothetical protein [Mycobacteroides abscessus]MDM2466135.1 hypothetical protein [Mycobacteroides abscessus]